MAVTTSNVLIGLATFYWQPYVSASPPALPADTVALGTAWSSPWVQPGATQDGLRFRVGQDVQDHYIEEQPTPVIVALNRTNLQIQISFAEDTLENMKLSYGGGTLTTTAAATGVPGTKQLTLPSTANVIAAGFEGRNTAGFWRRVLIPQMMSSGDVETPYRRAEGYRVYPVTFRAICAPADVVIREMTAAAL